MKKTVVYILNVLFIILIGVLTFNLLFKDQELGTIISDLGRANPAWLLAGAVLAVLFVAGESVIIRYMLGMFRTKVPLRRCLKYSFIGFFYSYITPSSSGGQPAQLIYMRKDGIPLGQSSLVLLVITITFKAVLVVFGTVFFIFEYSFVREVTGDWFWLLLVGFGLNVAYIAGLLLLLLRPAAAGKLMSWTVRALCRIKLLKRSRLESYLARVKRLEKTYTEGAEYMKTHLGAVAKIFLMTCAQRLCYFAIAWVVYRSCGLSGTGFLGIVTVQTMIAITVEMLPLPGAAGITEACFLVMFGGIFGEGFVKTGMLLNRGLTYYVILMIGAAVTLTAHILAVKKSAAENTVKKKEQNKMAA